MSKKSYKIYKFRLYPTKAQVKTFETWLELCRELYNAALQERREEAPTHFLVVTTDACRRWRGATLTFEQIDSIEPHPSLKELGAFGLIE